jgi:hypothetical protein
MRSVSCADAGSAKQVVAKIAVAIVRWSVLNMMILHGCELPSDRSIF